MPTTATIYRSQCFMPIFFQPLHNFLSQQPYHSTNNNTTYDNEDEMLNNQTTGSNSNINRNSNSRPNFKLGEYYSSNNSSRPASALSAHERLFGTSRYSKDDFVL
jgi:hypothetical protein